tara:strand:+ start:509 stop:745 length:237 start_codon:yes stop_codon:yes gene_type:complete
MNDSIKNIIKNDFEKEQNLKIGEWKILFGKYKNKTYNEVLVDDEGKQYLKWCYLEGLFDDVKYKNNIKIKSFLEIKLI